MSKPTHSQWRGYAVLSAILLILLIVIIFWPLRVDEPVPSDHSQLSEAVALYGDEIILREQANADSYRLRYRSQRDSFHYQRPKEWERSSRFNPYDTLLVDLNTADTSRLQQLRGIGPVFASRIVKYRSLLGGFVSTDQLLEVYGFTEDRLASVEPHLTLSESDVKLLPINSATLNELRRHPYLDYYQARAIIDYRKSVGSIKSQDDLLKIPLLDENTIRKITPYIQYNP